jgi:soluble lytic murein transglycosylase-like protein
MKRTLFILCLAVSALPARAGLWEAVCRVESGGNPRAVGDGGKAAGIAQIWAITVKDINRFAGTKYTLNDRFDPVKSKQMFNLYVEHYGKGRSLQYKARLWNGGPGGNNKTATIAYWKKIQKHL